MKPIILFALFLFSINSYAYLTPNDFNNLNANGNLSPDEIRFSQDSISQCFSNGEDIDTLITALEDGDVTRDDVPAIRIVVVSPAAAIRPTPPANPPIIGEGVYTLDNRRLYAFQQAGVNIRYTKLNNIPNTQRFKFTTDDDGQTINIRVRVGGCPGANAN